MSSLAPAVRDLPARSRDQWTMAPTAFGSQQLSRSRRRDVKDRYRDLRASLRTVRKPIERYLHLGLHSYLSYFGNALSRQRALGRFGSRVPAKSRRESSSCARRTRRGVRRKSFRVPDPGSEDRRTAWRLPGAHNGLRAVVRARSRRAKKRFQPLVPGGAPPTCLRTDDYPARSHGDVARPSNL